MSYTIAAGTSFNMVLSHIDHSDPTEWTEVSAINDMRRHFADWDPAYVQRPFAQHTFARLVDRKTSQSDQPDRKHQKVAAHDGYET